MSNVKAQEGATFSSALCAILYDASTGTNGGLSTGLGYNPLTADGTTKTIQAIGGIDYTVKAHNVLGATPLVTEKGENIVTNSKQEIVA